MTSSSRLLLLAFTLPSLAALALPSRALAQVPVPPPGATPPLAPPPLTATVPAALPAPAPEPLPGAAPLGLREVLDSVARHYPLLDAAQQDVEVARAAAREADGGFDYSWRTRAALAPLGYYRNMQLDSVFEVPTQLWGLRAFAGWRLGEGKFPVYYGQRETNERGEARAGLFLPILRGGPIDSRRAAIQVAQAGIASAEANVTERRLEYVRLAAQRYWTWVAAGRRLQITKMLLARAVDRDAGLATRVERGDLSAIERLDNSRAILQRQNQVVSAERNLTREGFSLSLFLRTSDGRPLVPPLERLPTTFPEPALLTGSPKDKAEQALDRRPEVRRLELLRRQLDTQRSLHSNTRLPALDFQVTVSRDLGTGSPTREPTEVEGMLLLDIPIQNRAATGRLAQAEARLARNSAELRLLRDRIEAEVRDAMNAVDMAYRGVEVARRELELARRLEQAERQNFDLGASSLLVVNLREQATFEAAQREVDALSGYQIAYISYRVALGELGE
jgi:cobalt-zinc-cadmium efflux system outer membrane protein